MKLESVKSGSEALDSGLEAEHRSVCVESQDRASPPFTASSKSAVAVVSNLYVVLKLLSASLEAVF